MILSTGKINNSFLNILEAETQRYTILEFLKPDIIEFQRDFDKMAKADLKKNSDSALPRFI